MSGIGGQIRETQEVSYAKKVGLFEAKVVAINPTREEYSSILGIELPEESKADEYLYETKDGDTRLKVDVWFLKVDDDSVKMKTTFFLEDRVRMNKDETKTQFINNIGQCTWGVDDSDLPEWFEKNREVREAYAGEELFYNFLRSWLNKLDYRLADTVLSIEWKKIMKNNLKDIQGQIDGEFSGTLGVLATVAVREEEDGIKEYQNIYNKSFLPAYALKQFKLIDYEDRNIQNSLIGKKQLKPHERFVLNVVGEYGCKDNYILSELKDFDSSQMVAANEGEDPSSDGADY